MRYSHGNCQDVTSKDKESVLKLCLVKLNKKSRTDNGRYFTMPSKMAKHGQAVSLEGERRKAMMLVHSVEKDVVLFRDKYFKKPRNQFSEDTNDFIAFVLEKTGSTKRHPKDFREFAMLVDKTRNSAALLYRDEMSMVDAVIERQRMFEDLVASGLERLDAALTNHIARYCHSFASEAQGVDIRCVQDYENNITRWKEAIKDGKSLMLDIQKSLKDLGSPFHHFVRNYSKILHYIGLSLEVFPKIYNPMKDWVTADEAYARKLNDAYNVLTEMKMNTIETSRRQQLRAENLHHKEQHQSYMTKKLKGRLQDAMEDRKFCRKRELAFADSYGKVDTQLRQKRTYLDEILGKIYLREPNHREVYDRHMSSVTSLQEEIQKLEKRQAMLQKSLDDIRRERYMVSKEVHKLQVMYDKSGRADELLHTNAEAEAAGVKVFQGENRLLAEKIDIIKRIRALKTHPQTVKHIQMEGYSPGRPINISDQLSTAFRIVSPDVGRDWAYLYQKLPFTPYRDFTARAHDVELIDLSAQRNDLNLRETTLKCLERWRRLSHDATVKHLVTALKEIKKRDIARKLERELLVTS